MDTKIEIKKENLDIAYQEADQTLKTFLEKLFGIENFTKKPLIERVKSFDDILVIAKRSKEEFFGIEGRLTSDEIAYRKIKLIAEVLNEGWSPDWSDSSQYKYYPWFKYDSSAGGFAYGGYVRWTSRTGVGSRLCYKTAELAEFAGTTFIDIYNDFLTLNK